LILTNRQRQSLESKPIKTSCLGKEFPSAGIRFPSSPSLVRAPRAPSPLRHSEWLLRRSKSGAKATALQTLARPPSIFELREAFGLRRVHRRFCPNRPSQNDGKVDPHVFFPQSHRVAAGKKCKAYAKNRVVRFWRRVVKLAPLKQQFKPTQKYELR
jgi:hypothetical protein